MRGIKTIAKGIATGVAVGTVCYVISQSTPHQKREMKRNAERTIHSFGSVINTFSSMMR